MVNLSSEPRLSTVGEFGLIDRLAAMLGAQADGPLAVGIGDDAAVWKAAPDRLLTATTDVLVEGVHFSLDTSRWEDVGWKALAENLSDIAAMGCSPRYALVAIVLPPETAIADVEALYSGLRACAATFGCAIIGGDTARGPLVVLDVTVIGESQVVTSEHDYPLLTRSAARPGDLLAVTGPLGGSAAGLRLLSEGSQIDLDDGPLLAAHRRPVPRVAAGSALVEAGVRCGIDVSDGLLADVGHICERSGHDAEIDAAQVPVHPAARARFGDAALDLALSGGEDYELVCAGSRDILAEASARLVDLGEPPLTVIGRILPQRGPAPEVRLVGPDGRAMSGRGGGYQHFRE